MRLKPGKPTLSARALQRQLRKLGVRYGYRKGLRELGPIGLWIACLSQTDNVREAAREYQAWAKAIGRNKG